MKYYEAIVRFNTDQDVDRTEIKSRLFSTVNLEFNIDDIELKETEGEDE